MEHKNVEAVFARGETLEGRFVKAVTWPPKDLVNREGVQTRDVTNFETTLPVFLDPGFEGFLIGHGVEIRAQSIQGGGGLLRTLLVGFGPALFFMGFYLWMLRRAAAGGSGGLMPMFSVDGKQIIFNQVDPSDAMTGRTLAVMDFDAHTNKFSNLRSVYRSEKRFPGWPFYLPEVARDTQGGTTQMGRRVIFVLGECDFGSSGLSATPHQGDLWWLDIDSGKAAPLATANGDDATGKTYLPYPDRDPHLNFYPTVSPVAAGGYFWVFFTSKRNYGNVQATDTADGHSESKKIWVSAIDIDAAPGTDPSHPAFLLPGQELESGNSRAFASLEACRAETDSCKSGIDCCCGYCTDNRCECKKTTACSKLNERCSSAADCCDSHLYCIGGYCGEVIDPQ